MEQFSAAAIYELATAFEQVRATCNFVERAGHVNFSGSEMSVDSMESIELLPTRSARNLWPDWQKNLPSILSSVEKQCEMIGLKLAAQTARDYRTEVESGRIKTFGAVYEAVGILSKLVTLQLRENLFMFVPTGRAEFYGKPQLFGAGVDKRFPSCQYDIEEAGNCYAAGRGTACAFHLMRVLEVAVWEFGMCLGAALTQGKNWQNILDEINKAIKSLPAKDTRTIALSQAAGHLYNVKVAWRNPTMHPKTTYTLEEAADLISSVKSFMTELSQAI